MAVYLELETIAGGDVEDAISDACRVATLLDVWVKVNINGVETLVSPNDMPEPLFANWQKAMERGADFVSANVIPRGKTPEHQRVPS
jgi:hypothetical protein